MVSILLDTACTSATTTRIQVSFCKGRADSLKHIPGAGRICWCCLRADLLSTIRHEVGPDGVVSSHLKRRARLTFQEIAPLWILPAAPAGACNECHMARPRLRNVTTFVPATQSWHEHCNRVPPENSQGGDMGTEYAFLCGVMWCNYGHVEAGRELARLTGSSDPDIRALAGAMLTKGIAELKEQGSRCAGR